MRLEVKDMGELVGFRLKGKRTEVEQSSEIYALRGTDGRDDGFETLLCHMGDHGLKFHGGGKGRTQGPDGLIPRDAVVVVKVNSQWNERGGTNTDLVRSVIRAILAHPEGFTGEVVVADNGQAQFGAHGQGGSLDYERNNARDRGQSIQDVVDSFEGRRVSTYLWDRITTNKVEEYFMGDHEDGYVLDDEPNPATGIRVSYPKFTTIFGTKISFRHGVWFPETSQYDSESLKVVNVPVLKAHFIYGVTACVKHYMGVVSDKLTGRGAHRSVGRGGMGTEMAGTRMPTLNVLDAIWVNSTPGKGPRCSYDEATRLNTVMASVDPVALDFWATRHVLMQAARLQGHKDLSKFDPENTQPGSHGDWFRRSAEEIRKVGHRVTLDERMMNVFTAEL